MIITPIAKNPKEPALWGSFLIYKKNSEIRSGAGDSESSGQKKAMNSVRVVDEYWLKPRPKSSEKKLKYSD